MEALATYNVTKDLVEEIEDRITALHISKKRLAEELGVDRSTISKYLNRNYTSDTTRIEEQLKQWLAETEIKITQLRAVTGTAPDSKPELFQKQECYESTDYVAVIGLCKECQTKHGLGIIVGRSGLGKTHTLKRYAKMPRVAYLECDDTMACKDLVTAIEGVLGIPNAYGTIWSRVNRIREFFNVNKGYLLILDEGDKLISRYSQKKMEIIRAIFDQTAVGIVIAGEPTLEQDIRAALPRMANRVDLYYKMAGLSKAEVREYFKGYTITEDALGEMVSRACGYQHGCFRLFDRTLNNVVSILQKSGKTEITMSVIKQASEMMML